MAAGVFTSMSAPADLLPIVKEWFGMNYDQLKPVLSRIADVSSTSRNHDIYEELVGIGMADELGEGDVVSYASHKQGRGRILKSTQYGKGMMITDIALEDGLALDHAKIMAKELAKSLFHNKESKGAAFFNNPTSTSDPYVGLDSVALLSTAHVAGNGATYANKPTSDVDLSEAALEDARVNVWNLIGDDGLRIMANAEKLLVPPQVYHDAARILKSEYRPGTADNDINVLNSDSAIKELIRWQFLTDADAWFVLTDIPGLKLVQRKEPSLSMHNDPYTRNVLYYMIERFVVNYVNARFVYGSTGS